MERIIIAIPTYNMADFICETVECCLAQDYGRIPIYIIDNNSTDNTHDVILKYLDNEYVYYIKNSTNIGMVENWNKCLELPDSEYVKILCADDHIYKKSISTCVSILDSNPDVAIVASKFEHFGCGSQMHFSPHHSGIIQVLKRLILVRL